MRRNAGPVELGLGVFGQFTRLTVERDRYRLPDPLLGVQTESGVGIRHGLGLETGYLSLALLQRLTELLRSTVGIVKVRWSRRGRFGFELVGCHWFIGHGHTT
jgi:hypothetical protein